jgi:hypothetical protein
MFKDGLHGATWHGKGTKIFVIEENEKILRKLGADVFKAKPKKKKATDDNSE